MHHAFSRGMQKLGEEEYFGVRVKLPGLPILKNHPSKYGLEQFDGFRKQTDGHDGPTRF